MSDVRNSLGSAQSDGQRDFAYGLGHDTYALCANLHSLNGEIHFGGEALKGVDMMQVQEKRLSNVAIKMMQSGGRNS